MSLTLKEISKLKVKKFREQHRATLLEGQHLVLELEKSSCQSAEILCTEAHACFATRFPKRILTQKQFAEISDVKTPQGIAAIVPFDTLYSLSEMKKKAQPTLYFSELQDPGNLGTIIRTAAWFQNCQLALSPNSTDPYAPKVIRSTMGGCLHVPLTQNFALETKKADPATVVCLDTKGPPIWEAPLEEISLFVFGNEARGVPQEFSHRFQRFSIPGAAGVESLNLSVTATTLMYELERQKKQYPQLLQRT